MAPAINPRAPLSVRLPEELERRLRQRAADAGVPVNAVVVAAIAGHLDACEPKEISR